MKCGFVIVAFGVLLIQTSVVHSKVYRRCELAHQLVAKYKFDRTLLSNCKYVPKSI